MQIVLSLGDNLHEMSVFFILEKILSTLSSAKFAQRKVKVKITKNYSYNCNECTVQNEMVWNTKNKIKKW